MAHKHQLKIVRGESLVLEEELRKSQALNGRLCKERNSLKQSRTDLSKMAKAEKEELVAKIKKLDDLIHLQQQSEQTHKDTESTLREKLRIEQRTSADWQSKTNEHEQEIHVQKEEIYRLRELNFTQLEDFREKVQEKQSVRQEHEDDSEKLRIGECNMPCIKAYDYFPHDKNCIVIINPPEKGVMGGDQTQYIHQEVAFHDKSFAEVRAERRAKLEAERVTQPDDSLVTQLPSKLRETECPLKVQRESYAELS